MGPCTTAQQDCLEAVELRFLLKIDSFSSSPKDPHEKVHDIFGGIRSLLLEGLKGSISRVYLHLPTKFKFQPTANSVSTIGGKDDWLTDARANLSSNLALSTTNTLSLPPSLSLGSFANLHQYPSAGDLPFIDNSEPNPPRLPPPFTQPCRLERSSF